MRKLFFAFIVFFVTVNGFCEGTVSTGILSWHGNKKTIMYVFTADGSASFATVSLTDKEKKFVDGYFLSHIDVKPGAIGPTDNCDLTFEVNLKDVLRDNGLDIVDGSAGDFTVPYGSGGDAQYPMFLQDVTIDVDDDDENSVANAEVTVTCFFEP